MLSSRGTRKSTFIEGAPRRRIARQLRMGQAQVRRRRPEGKIDDEFSGGGLPVLEPILAAYIGRHPGSFYRRT